MIRTTVVAAMLSVLPALAHATPGGCSSHQTASCAEGTVWDPATSSCVEQVTG